MISRLSITLLVFLFIRLVLMTVFPVTGDEAYYFYWGLHPAGGYYDLPPMIGWWLLPFAKVSLMPLWLRLPNLLSLVLVSASIYEWLKQGILKSRAKWIAGSFAMLPLPFLAVLMFPDIPLLFFSYFSAYLFFRAVTVQKNQAFAFLFSGALLGAAVLSKYFAAFLLPAYLIWFFTRKQKSFLGVAWFVAGGIPFALQHLLWNEQHCWSNIVFNFVTRQNASDGPLYQVLGLFVLYLGLASLPFWKAATSERLKLDLSKGLESAEWIGSLSSFVRLLWAVPVVIFTLTALKGRGQGLHWLLFILPFFVIWVGLKLDEEGLARNFKWITRMSAVLSALTLIVAIAPEKTLGSFFQHRFQFEFAHLNHREELIELILPDVSHADAVFTEGYTFSSVLNYDLQRYSHEHGKALPEVSVWGSGSRFGRVFDWTIDFSKLDGKKFVIITPGPFKIWLWTQYFTSLKTEERIFEGRTFAVTTGEGFKAADYLKNEFRKPVETYYGQLGARCSIWDQTHLN